MDIAAAAVAVAAGVAATAAVVALAAAWLGEGESGIQDAVFVERSHRAANWVGGELFRGGAILTGLGLRIIV